MSLRNLSQTALFRFLLVGGTFALLYALLTALVTTTIALPKPLLAALVWLVLIPPAFYCQRRFAFRMQSARRDALLIYAATQGLGMGIAALAGATLATGIFLPDALVYLGASALSAVISYAINRLVIFPVPMVAATGLQQDPDPQR